MTKQSAEIEIEILKQRIEAQDLRIKFLESNWLTWTRTTTDIGRQLVAALLEVKEKK